MENNQDAEQTVIQNEIPVQNNEHFDDFETGNNLKRLPLAILSGLGACLIGAIIWSIITVLTGYQIGYMSIGVGFLVGFAVKLIGRGNHIAFGIVGGVFALLGCILGNYFSLISFTATDLHLGFFETLTMFSPEIIVKSMIEAFAPMDILFYLIAIYQGFKFSLVY